MTTSTLDITAARAVRNHTVPWAPLVLYFFSIGMILGGILLAPADHPARWFDEKQTLTAYSAALLFAASLFCFFNCLATHQMRLLGISSLRETRFWAMGTFGFLFLMADEFFVMHEGIGRFLTHRLLNLPHSGSIDRLDAFVIGAYGAVGLVLLFWHWRDLANIRGFFAYLTIGSIMALVSLGLDLGEDGVVRLYIEDGTKILANASLLLACAAASQHYYRLLVARLHASRTASEATVRS